MSKFEIHRIFADDGKEFAFCRVGNRQYAQEISETYSDDRFIEVIEEELKLSDAEYESLIEADQPAVH